MVPLLPLSWTTSSFLLRLYRHSMSGFRTQQRLHLNCSEGEGVEEAFFLYEGLGSAFWRVPGNRFGTTRLVWNAIPLLPWERSKEGNKRYCLSIYLCLLTIVAMRQGRGITSFGVNQLGQVIHKDLENELHESMQFDRVTTAEETWAIKFLNILFGLRKLQLQEMTVRPGLLRPSNVSGNFQFLELWKAISSSAALIKSPLNQRLHSTGDQWTRS